MNRVCLSCSLATGRETSPTPTCFERGHALVSSRRWRAWQESWLDYPFVYPREVLASLRGATIPGQKED